MANKKDSVKLQNERHQLIVQELLKDEDNKYCVDCDAKGPRWASWNIGVFLCIRCAGIHRSLGVHISKVKSVNLDIWTPVQLAIMRDMGNSRGRAIYEAQLPDGFKRPQTDSVLEAFIRAKYEKKRYMAQEYIPSEPDVEGLVKEIERIEQGQKRRVNSNVSLGHNVPPINANANNSGSHLSKENETSDANKKSSDFDLLGFNCSSINTVKQAPAVENMFDPFNENAQPPAPVSSTQSNQPSSLDTDLFDLDFSNNKPIANSSKPNTPATDNWFNPTAEVSDTTLKKDRDSIMALYQQTPNQPNAFGAGVPYLPSYASAVSNAAPRFSVGTPNIGEAGSQNFPNSNTQFMAPNFGLPGVGPPPVNASAPSIPCQQPVWPQSTFGTQESTISPNPFFSHNSNAPWNTGHQGVQSGSFNVPQPVPQLDNQAYLSQIQGKLASLQMNGTTKPFS